MLVGSSNHDIARPLFAVRSEYEEGSICFFADFLEFSAVFEGVYFVFAGEHDTVVLSERPLGKQRCTKSFITAITSVLDLFPLTKRVDFAPSTNLGSSLRSLLIVRIDFGFSYI